MKDVLKIGNKVFKFKKDALIHFKKLLNSYNFNEVLSSEDFDDVLNLLKRHPRSKEKIGIGIEYFKIAKLKYNTKCFEFVRTDSTTGFFGYIKCIKGELNLAAIFNRACRIAIQDDLRNVKLEYFKMNSEKGCVKCQETGELLPYEELSVDHRQPNTFSVIVDRFVELNNIDFEKIEYVKSDNQIQRFLDETLIADFKKYHKEKANLRIIKKHLNLKRSFQARITTQKKDLKIK